MGLRDASASKKMPTSASIWLKNIDLHLCNSASTIKNQKISIQKPTSASRINLRPWFLPGIDPGAAANVIWYDDKIGFLARITEQSKDDYDNDVW